MTQPSTQFMTVARVYGVAEAMIVIAKLRSAGIFVSPLCLRTTSTAWQWTHALGGVEIQVMKPEATAASEILAEIEDCAGARWGLLPVAAAVMALLVAGLPPPASGLFLSRLTPTLDRRAD